MLLVAFTKPNGRVNLRLCGTAAHAQTVLGIPLDAYVFPWVRDKSLRHLSKLSRYALQAVVIPGFYTRKVS